MGLLLACCRDCIGAVSVIAIHEENEQPPSSDYREMPQNEHATMRIAEEAFRIRTGPSSLIRLLSGELA